MMKNNKYLYLIFAVVGFVFLKSGFEKIEAGKFVDGLSGTLVKFAKDNPYPFVKAFLENMAIPNSVLFGYLTEWGELLTGLNILGLSILMLVNSKIGGRFLKLMILGFGTGLLLNLIFWLTSGYTSASSENLNFVMGLINAIGLVFVINESQARSK